MLGIFICDSFFLGMFCQSSRSNGEMLTRDCQVASTRVPWCTDMPTGRWIPI
jgi:hypothetical protein